MKRVDRETLYAIPALRNAIQSARSRCSNPNNPMYPRYGARGIKVCDQWNDPESFILWAINEGGYKPKFFLDRIDNNGDYTPDNCHFVTALESSKNRSSTLRITIDGQTRTLFEWAKEWGLSYQTVRRRHLKGWRYPKIAAPPAPGPPRKHEDCWMRRKTARPLQRGARSP